MTQRRLVRLADLSKEEEGVLRTVWNAGSTWCAMGQNIHPSMVAVKADGGRRSLRVINLTSVIDTDKDAAALLHRSLVDSGEADFAIYSAESWMASVDKDEPVPSTIHDRENRTEAVIFTLLSKDSQCVAYSKITRPSGGNSGDGEKGSTLGPLADMLTGPRGADGTKIEGRFVHAEPEGKAH